MQALLWKYVEMSSTEVSRLPKSCTQHTVIEQKNCNVQFLVSVSNPCVLQLCAWCKCAMNIDEHRFNGQRHCCRTVVLQFCGAAAAMQTHMRDTHVRIPSKYTNTHIYTRIRTRRLLFAIMCWAEMCLPWQVADIRFCNSVFRAVSPGAILQICALQFFIRSV